MHEAGNHGLRRAERALREGAGAACCIMRAKGVRNHRLHGGESSMMLEDGLVWVDLEMTGLDPDRDRIIEIATIVTDAALNIVAEGPVLAIHQREEALAAMDEWNTRQHGQSGLTERVRASHCDEDLAQELALEFLSRHVAAGKSPM